MASCALTCPALTRLLRDNTRLPDACAAVPAGALADGSPCNSPHECANGVCQRSPGAFCGVCAAAGDASGFCYVDADCKADQGCRGNACVAYGEKGAACDDQTPCHRDLACVSGHCGALLADGAACDPYAQENPCSADYRFCSQATNKCVAINGSKVGGSCGYSNAGDLTLCGLGGRCHITNHQSFSGSCVAAAKAGEACTFISGIDGSQCEAGTACVYGTCQPTAQAQCDGTAPLPGGAFKTTKHTSFPQVPKGTGPVLSSVELVTVTFAGYPYIQEAQAFGDWVVGSSYLKAVGADYGVGLGTHVKKVALGVPPPGTGNTVDDVDIQTWIEAQIASGALPAPPNKNKNQYLYMLYFPSSWSVTLQGQSSCQSFGGYHSGLTGKVKAAYAVANDCGQGFGEVSVTASHELLEAASDPYPETQYAYAIRDLTSPFAVTGGEIGDLCTQSNTVLGGFDVQRIWSNTAAAAGGDPCIPAPPNETYYGVTASPADTQVAAVGQTVTFTVQGWSSGPMDDWSLYVMPAQSTFQAKTSLSTRLINNGETATFTVTVPAGTPSMSLAAYTINATQNFGGDSHAWPVAVYVPLPPVSSRGRCTRPHLEAHPHVRPHPQRPQHGREGPDAEVGLVQRDLSDLPSPLAPRAKLERLGAAVERELAAHGEPLTRSLDRAEREHDLGEARGLEHRLAQVQKDPLAVRGAERARSFVPLLHLADQLERGRVEADRERFAPRAELPPHSRHLELEVVRDPGQQALLEGIDETPGRGGVEGVDGVDGVDGRGLSAASPRRTARTRPRSRGPGGYVGGPASSPRAAAQAPWPGGFAPRAGTAHVAPSLKPSLSMPSAWLKRAR